MERISLRTDIFRRSVLFGSAVLFAAGIAVAADSPLADAQSQDELWRQTIDLAVRGDFKAATDTARKVHTGWRLTEEVRAWLEDYEAKTALRKEMDRADTEKYIGYAKARIERKEYDLALRWALAALDNTSDREAFLRSPWLQDLVNESLTAAAELRGNHKWRDAWHVYSRLSSLFEREPRYQKLEREVLTLLRLDVMFKEGSKWEERIEKVRWKDAKKALEYVDDYYVEPVDFKEIAHRGLEHLLLLAESKTAREQLAGLRNEDDRKDFELRVGERLAQIAMAPSVDREECVKHFRRVVKSINPQTINLAEELIVSELVRGALDPLDDFTTVIWPSASEEFDKHTRGDFVGVGISIIKNYADEIEVVTPLEESSAYDRGIQAGDIITKVDDVSLKGYSLNKVVRTITGPPRSSVTLTIRRNGEAIEFPLVRAKVKIRSVKGVRRDPKNEERWDHWLDRDRGIGYIRITNFQRNTVEDLDNVLSGMVGLKGLVLDVRGNPGGLLDSAYHLATRFLKRNDIVVTTKGRIKSEDQLFETTGNGAFADLSLVVLVDERSASASEIVSGAVRDNGRGIVVGERTFGKFSVQNLIPLSRLGAKLKITTASYYLPSGVSLHRSPEADEWGVEPDIPIRLVSKEARNVYALWREANLLGPPKDTSEKTDDEAGSTADEPAAEGEKASTAESGESDDYESSEEKLPPLEQPDENDRPKEDPQLDAALLLMRLTLIGESFPTLAHADTHKAPESAQP